MKNPQTNALVAALTATGACVGLDAALVWRSAIPHGADAVDYFSGVRPSWFPATLYLVAGSERLVEFSWTAITFADDDVSTSFRPTIAYPWIIFPAGGAAIAGLLALSLSLRDLRLTGRA